MQVFALALALSSFVFPGVAFVLDGLFCFCIYNIKSNACAMDYV